MLNSPFPSVRVPIVWIVVLSFPYQSNQQRQTNVKFSVTKSSTHHHNGKSKRLLHLLSGYDHITVLFVSSGFANGFSRNLKGKYESSQAKLRSFVSIVESNSCWCKNGERSFPPLVVYLVHFSHAPWCCPQKINLVSYILFIIYLSIGSLKYSIFTIVAHTLSWRLEQAMVPQSPFTAFIGFIVKTTTTFCALFKRFKGYFSSPEWPIVRNVLFFLPDMFWLFTRMRVKCILTWRSKPSTCFKSLDINLMELVGGEPYLYLAPARFFGERKEVTWTVPCRQVWALMFTFVHQR